MFTHPVPFQNSAQINQELTFKRLVFKKDAQILQNLFTRDQQQKVMQEYEAASAQIIGFQNLPRASRLGLNVWLLDEQGNGVVGGGLGLPLFSLSGYLHNGPESYHLWPFEEFNRNIICFEQNHEMRVDLEHGPSIDESKMPEDAHDSFLMRQPSDDEPRRASAK